jgi:Ras-related protein Rab-23
MSEVLSLKIIVVGNGTVGKSSLAQRFAKGNFTDEYKKTLGVDFLMKKREISNTNIEFLIWDTAGQEYYDSITRRYYKGANGAVLVFSVDNRESFNSIPKWKDKIIAECGRIPMVLVKNKIDIQTHEVSSEEASLLSEKLRINLLNVSVKDNICVNNVFDHLAMKVLAQNKENEIIENNNKDNFNSNIVNQMNKGNNFNLSIKNIVKQGNDPNDEKVDLSKGKKEKKKIWC